MPLPQLPWYNKLEKAIAPTEPAANLLLVMLMAITLVILLWGSPTWKAAWAIYLVSP